MSRLSLNPASFFMVLSSIILTPYTILASPCSINEVYFNDANGLYSHGDGNKTISPFETIDLEVHQNKDISMLFKSSSLLLLSSFVAKSNPLEHHFIVTPKIDSGLTHKKEVHFSLNCLNETQNYVLPYKHNLGDSRELNRQEKQIRAFDFKDPYQLDDFLKKYPESEHAVVIFNLRIKLLQIHAQEAKTNDALYASINNYHEFIKIYPNTVGALNALQDVYQLYVRLNTLNGYMDFLHRYPQSPEAMLADRAIKKMIWTAIDKADELEGYEYFLQSYPEAEPYSSAAAIKIESLSLAREKHFIDNLQSLSSDSPQMKEIIIDKRLNERAASIFQQWNDLRVAQLKTKHSLVKIEVFEKLLTQYYSLTYPFSSLSLSKQIGEVLKSLEALRELVQQQHQQTRAQIKDHFDQLERSLDQRFAKTQQTLKAMEQKLDLSEQRDLDIIKRLKAADVRDQELAQQLVTYHNELQKEAGEIKGQLKSSQRLEMLSQALSIGVSLYDLYRAPQKITNNQQQYHFNPTVRMNLNNRANGPSKLARLATEGACTGAGVLTSTFAVSSGVAAPLAPFVGGAVKLGCNWGLEKLFG